MTGTNAIPLAEFDKPDRLARLIAGDEDEHDKLYEAALPALAAHIRRVFKGEADKKVFTDDEANLIASDAIMAARESIADFDTTRPETLSALLVTIAFNKAKDRIRWRKRSNRDPLDRHDLVFMDDPDSLESPSSQTATPKPLKLIPEGTELFSEKKIERLRAAAERIPAPMRYEIMRQVFNEKLTEEERLTIILRMEELSDKQIAENLSRTTNYVRVNRGRALDKWASELERRLKSDER
jgi:RNA polymerase sigma factor (sigma-70 family)